MRRRPAIRTNIAALGMSSTEAIIGSRAFFENTIAAMNVTRPRILFSRKFRCFSSSALYTPMTKITRQFWSHHLPNIIPSLYAYQNRIRNTSWILLAGLAQRWFSEWTRISVCLGNINQLARDYLERNEHKREVIYVADKRVWSSGVSICPQNSASLHLLYHILVILSLVPLSPK